MFQIGSKTTLLNALGIPYGYISHETEGSIYLVANLADGYQQLQELHSLGYCTSEEVEAGKQAMQSASLFKNPEELFRHIEEFDVGDYSIEYVTDCCRCDAIPLPHSLIIRHGTSVDGPVSTLYTGFYRVANMVQRNICTAKNGIVMLQQMMHDGLVMTASDWKQQFNRLPEKKRDMFLDSIKLNELLSLINHPQRTPIPLKQELPGWWR